MFFVFLNPILFKPSSVFASERRLGEGAAFTADLEIRTVATLATECRAEYRPSEFVLVTIPTSLLCVFVGPSVVGLIFF